MEVQAEEVLARAFDSDDFNPFSSPLDAARYLLQQLEKEGFKVERVDGQQTTPTKGGE